ncbi:MAG: PIN domain-containing protein [archaeon]
MILDTWAWIELFKGSAEGQKVKELLHSNKCYTSGISIAELSEWIEKGGADRKFVFRTIEGSSTVLEVNRETLELSGILKAEKRKTIKDFGMIDAIILATAKQYNLPVVTGDRHFRGENAVML